MNVTDEEFNLAVQKFEKFSDDYFRNREELPEEFFMRLMIAQSILYEAKTGDEELRVKFVGVVNRIENMTAQKQNEEENQKQ